MRWQEKADRKNTSLTKEALLEIAVALDGASFKLFNELQPKQLIKLKIENDLMVSRRMIRKGNVDRTNVLFLDITYLGVGKLCA